jgi:hypothetical protein
MNVRWDLLISLILTAAVATPALGQTAVPAGELAGGTSQSAASIPDLTGLWGHPSLPGFEPPASGPGPVRNRSRLPNGVSNFNRLVGDYTNPILKPEAAEIVREHGEISLKGEGYPTPSNQCWPGGVPYLFTSFVIQLIQQVDRVTILYGQNHEARRIWLNQSHPAHVTPSWNGDSVGHYEGDTLVVDTVGIKVEPFNLIDMYGTPHTEALHVVERYRMLEYEDAKEGFERDAKENLIVAANVDPNYKGRTLQLQFIVEDEGVFTVPWSATITYRPAFGGWQENICAENTRYYPGKFAEVPTADEPDF